MSSSLMGRGVHMRRGVFSFYKFFIKKLSIRISFQKPEVFGELPALFQNSERNKMKNSFSFFCNKDCEYFPCHEGMDIDFNCLFCFFPLYKDPDCGGVFIRLKSGIKDCSCCTFPHKAENYPEMLRKTQKILQEEK